MNIYKEFRDIVETAVRSLGLPGDLDFSRITVEPPRDPSHGDMATNAAMVLSKQAGKNPREIGEGLARKLADNDNIEGVDVAGPGFVNFRLREEKWQNCLVDVLNEGVAYGDCNLGRGEKVNVEYVSANPTGPIHLAHTRGAIFGDALCNLLEKAGYDVTREYYINDAGNQVGVLARSCYLRYREALGEDIGAIPEGLYPGEYLKPVGEALKQKFGDSLKDKPEEDWFPVVRQFAIDKMIERIKADLALLGVHQHVFTSEKQLRDDGKVEEAFNHLMEEGLVYQGTLPPPKSKNAKTDDWEEAELTLLKSSQFGDESDRPLKNSKGDWTYITPDIAYHYDKFKRGFKNIIDVVGADHAGWVPRITAGTKAVTDNQAKLTVHLVALVKLVKNGVPVKLSKRRGEVLTIDDVKDEIPPDALRFTMLTRSNTQALDLDLVKAVEQSKDNPVFYVQYCHARCCSVLRHAAEAEWYTGGLEPEGLAAANLALLDSPQELALIKKLAGWPRLAEAAAEAHEPHRIAFFLYEVAAEFHALWNYGRDHATLRFLIEDNPELTKARLALVKSVALVIASGLKVIGVQPVEEMHS